MIHVTWANYGRQIITSQLCPFSNGPTSDDTNCLLDVTAAICAQCGAMNTCIIYGDIGVVGDPCSGTYKYLEVHYQCITMNQPMGKPRYCFCKCIYIINAEL